MDVRLFVYKKFDRWAGEEGVNDETLLETAEQALAGAVDADLGAYLFKKRVARLNEGKSGGYRTILCFKKSSDSPLFFLHGFRKNEKDNITKREKAALKLLVASLVSLTDLQIADLIEIKTIREIKRSSKSVKTSEN